MNVPLLRALVVLAPTCTLLCGALVLFLRGRTLWSLLQVVGAAGLVLVAITHVFEALHLFPWMRWGLEDSVGHYFDLLGAMFGLILFPAGYLLHAVQKQHA